MLFTAQVTRSGTSGAALSALLMLALFSIFLFKAFCGPSPPADYMRVISETGRGA
jgi:hypothetical protein